MLLSTGHILDFEATRLDFDLGQLRDDRRALDFKSELAAAVGAQAPEFSVFTDQQSVLGPACCSAWLEADIFQLSGNQHGVRVQAFVRSRRVAANLTELVSIVEPPGEQLQVLGSERYFRQRTRLHVADCVFVLELGCV